MPSSELSLDSVSSDEEYRLAQQEWEESLAQLTHVLEAIFFPMLGKFLGRRWSYWAYARYLRLGLGRAFFGF